MPSESSGLFLHLHYSGVTQLATGNTTDSLVTADTVCHTHLFIKRFAEPCSARPGCRVCGTYDDMEESWHLQSPQTDTGRLGTTPLLLPTEDTSATSCDRQNTPRTAPHCRVLPHSKCNGILIPEPLPFYSESLTTTTVIISRNSAWSQSYKYQI